MDPFHNNQKNQSTSYKIVILRDMFQRFGRVTHSSETKTRAKYREQTHIHDMMHVTLPLENDEYSKLPGDPQWNDDDHLDDEDKRDSPLRAGIGPYPSS